MKLKIPAKRHHTNKDGTCDLVRLKTYPINTIFDFIKNNPVEIKQKFKKDNPLNYFVDEEGNKCKLRRARIFFEIGIDCVDCSTKAQFFALEKFPNGQLHFDLYGVDEVGDDVLMTIDHALAKSNGGENKVENYSPMCKVCNELKSNF